MLSRLAGIHPLYCIPHSLFPVPLVSTRGGVSPPRASRLIIIVQGSIKKDKVGEKVPGTNKEPHDMTCLRDK
jgi:hypothetical protein